LSGIVRKQPCYNTLFWQSFAKAWFHSWTNLFDPQCLSIWTNNLKIRMTNFFFILTAILNDFLWYFSYERMPHDFSTTDMPPQLERCGYMMALTANKVAFNIYTTLSRYLFHRRWVWSVQHGSSMPVSMQAIGRILSNLTK
jgi:hypothetical protein